MTLHLWKNYGYKFESACGKRNNEALQQDIDKVTCRKCLATVKWFETIHAVRHNYKTDELSFTEDVQGEFKDGVRIYFQRRLLTKEEVSPDLLKMYPVEGHRAATCVHCIRCREYDENQKKLQQVQA